VAINPLIWLEMTESSCQNVALPELDDVALPELDDSERPQICIASCADQFFEPIAAITRPGLERFASIHGLALECSSEIP
jgi:hypothetical protein